MAARELAGIMGVIILAGCGQKQESAHPVSWYEQHAKERDAKVAWCGDDAQRQHMPDCENAAEAKRRSLVGSQKDLKPIDWGASAAKP